MGEILGLGVTHHPGFLGKDENLADLLRRTLKSERVPAHLKDSRNWPAAMQAEWSDDGGRAAATAHRRQLMDGFAKVRARLDAFRPDFVLIWGDDQYEQFREDCVPPFGIFIFDQFECQPYLTSTSANPGANNVWGDPVEKVFRFNGHAAGASYLTQKLIESSFDMAYSYKVRDGLPLPHSFLNTIQYLDYERRGFDYPIVPFHVNCYGSTVIRSRGSVGHLFADGAERRFDPISPTAARCFQIGEATARILRESPWRVAVVASSSWSHAFLTEKTGWIHPDQPADQRCYDELRAARYTSFRDLKLPEVEEAGQQEILNWVCLAGAMHALGSRPDFIDFVGSWIFNSTKVMATFTAA
ncbi:MAG: extradiol ring-cleavage dioxygenase [Alphaproteobacteria bacterium]